MIFRELIQNVLILIVFSYLYSLLYRSRFKTRPLYYKTISGLLFGMIAILGMMFPFFLTAGVMFDGRAIILCIAGLFGGALSAVIAAVSTGIFRYLAGGTGTWTGIAAICLSAFTGIVFHYFLKSGKFSLSMLNIYLFGLLVNVEMILLLFTLPEPINIIALNKMSIPLITIYPLVTVVISKMLLDQEKKAETEKQLRKYQQKLEDIVAELSVHNTEHEKFQKE